MNDPVFHVKHPEQIRAETRGKVSAVKGWRKICVPRSKFFGIPLDGAVGRYANNRPLGWFFRRSERTSPCLPYL